MQQQPFDWKKYIIVFLITATIFSTAMYASNYFNDKKINEVRAIEDKISIDMLSSETQFNLLESSTCQGNDGSLLSTELNSLSSKLSYTEENLGATSAEVVQLKKYYSLLQIKDYLLMQKISDKCDINPVFVLYFYSNLGDCPDCQKEGYVLTYLREKYPALRVYSFDYNIDLSAVQTLVSMNKLSGALPAIVLNDKTYYGFQSVDDLEALLPESLKQMASTTANAAATAASSTKATPIKTKR